MSKSKDVSVVKITADKTVVSIQFKDDQNRYYCVTEDLGELFVEKIPDEMMARVKEMLACMTIAIDEDMKLEQIFMDESGASSGAGHGINLKIIFSEALI